jgi:hypothetical protein
MVLSLGEREAKRISSGCLFLLMVMLVFMNKLTTAALVPHVGAISFR